MELALVGFNHRTTPLTLLEQVVYPPDQVLATLADLRHQQDVGQAMLLSTCNRTELYVADPDIEAKLDWLRDTVFRKRLPESRDDDGLVVHRSQYVVRHLFRVACGLDSMVLGEKEILGQLKSAYELSRSANMAGAILHRLASKALHVSKRARSETSIDVGCASVAHSAVELVEKVFADLAGHGVLLVGAGRNGTLCARHLAARQVQPLLIANRSADKALQLADDLGGQSVRFDRLPEALAQADIVITTTGATEPIIDREMVAQAMRARSQRRMVFVDIALPRDVARDVEKIPGVFTFDLEALRGIVEQAVDRRRVAVPAVERMVENESERFMSWLNTLDAGSTIRELHRQFESIAAWELERNAKRFEPGDRRQLGAFTRNLISKLLMGPTKEIKGYRLNDPVQTQRLAALRDVFHLDEDEDEDRSNGGPDAAASG
jgi:glutamyl-tRNA reductase